MKDDSTHEDAVTDDEIEAAAAWVAKRSDDPQNPVLEEEFSAWLEQSSRHWQAYTAAEVLFGKMSTLEAHPQDALERVQKSLDSNSKSDSPWRQPKSLLALAACIAILLTISGIGTSFWQDPNFIETVRAEQRIMVLPDDSQITLDAASAVRVDFSEDRRRLHLENGAAVFVVAEDTRPFEVWVGDALIRDIGTTFSVKLQSSVADRENLDSPAFTVAVEEGEVAVSYPKNSRGSSEPLSILAGMKADITSPISIEKEAIKPIEENSFATWRDYRLYYRDEALAQVLADLERHHKVSFRIGNDDLAQQKISGILDSANLEEALEVLSRVLPINFEKKFGGRVEVTLR